MSSVITISHNQSEDNHAVWESLKEAIAKSSGFECWQQKHIDDDQLQVASLDQKVSCYLRETLETLAY